MIDMNECELLEEEEADGDDVRRKSIYKPYVRGSLGQTAWYNWVMAQRMLAEALQLPQCQARN